MTRVPLTHHHALKATHTMSFPKATPLAKQSPWQGAITLDPKTTYCGPLPVPLSPMLYVTDEDTSAKQEVSPVTSAMTHASGGAEHTSVDVSMLLACIINTKLYNIPGCFHAGPVSG